MAQQIRLKTQSLVLTRVKWYINFGFLNKLFFFYFVANLAII